MHDTFPGKGCVQAARDLFKFLEISDKISLMMQDRDMVAREQ